MRQVYKEKKNTNRKQKTSQYKAYKEMERCKLKDLSVVAFRHKPYTLDWKEERENELGR